VPRRGGIDPFRHCERSEANQTVYFVGLAELAAAVSNAGGLPSCKELVDRIMAEAEQIIRDRWIGFLDGTGATRKVA
jgi:hypothetical protein